MPLYFRVLLVVTFVTALVECKLSNANVGKCNHNNVEECKHNDVGKCKHNNEGET